MHITLSGKTLEIRLSSRAEHALAARTTPLLAEMELLFSCMIRKRVRFHDSHLDGAQRVSERLSVRFRPVMTKACLVSSVAGSPPVEDFPIADSRPWVPRWLSLDYRHGKWSGEFGYAEG